MNGSPATSIMAFGTFTVWGRSLAASPPANKASGGMSLDKSFGTFEIEAESDLFKARFAQRVPQALLVLRVEQEETAAASADHFPAYCAIAHRKLIPPVDVRIGHGTGALFLMPPVLVHECAEFVQIASLK